MGNKDLTHLTIVETVVVVVSFLMSTVKSQLGQVRQQLTVKVPGTVTFKKIQGSS